jgi:hypothetical protein
MPKRAATRVAYPHRFLVSNNHLWVSVEDKKEVLVQFTRDPQEERTDNKTIKLQDNLEAVTKVYYYKRAFLSLFCTQEN